MIDDPKFQDLRLKLKNHAAEAGGVAAALLAVP
jgi:hypothetical protein